MQRLASQALRRSLNASSRSISAAHAVPTRCFSITYSGGQASSGQGGFYGSGGSRAKGQKIAEHHPEALVDNLKDLATLSTMMAEIEDLSAQLEASIGTHGSSVNESSIELKAALRRKLTGKAMSELLARLEINGEPRWGLSSQERELVKYARSMFNNAP